ncbi:MAG: response regulator [Bryobacteraceae bacterium]
MAKTQEAVEILLVEDNAGDVILTKEALSESETDYGLHVVSDGLEAMRFLRREGGYRNMPRPGLILLDLNLPKKDGREVLADIKSDPHLKNIPVVVMTSSAAEDDIMRSYALHANCYVTKGANWDEHSRVIRSIQDFWLGRVRLPR